MPYRRFTKCDSADVAIMKQNLFSLVTIELADRNSLNARKFCYQTLVLMTADNVESMIATKTHINNEFIGAIKLLRSADERHM